MKHDSLEAFLTHGLQLLYRLFFRRPNLENAELLAWLAWIVWHAWFAWLAWLGLLGLPGLLGLARATLSNPQLNNLNESSTTLNNKKL